MPAIPPRRQNGSARTRSHLIGTLARGSSLQIASSNTAGHECQLNRNKGGLILLYRSGSWPLSKYREAACCCWGCLTNASPPSLLSLAVSCKLSRIENRKREKQERLALKHKRWHMICSMLSLVRDIDWYDSSLLGLRLLGVAMSMDILCPFSCLAIFLVRVCALLAMVVA